MNIQFAIYHQRADFAFSLDMQKLKRFHLQGGLCPPHGGGALSPWPLNRGSTPGPRGSAASYRLTPALAIGPLTFILLPTPLNGMAMGQIHCYIQCDFSNNSNDW